MTSTFRHPLRDTEIDIKNCSVSYIRVNGSARREISPINVRRLLSRETDAVIDLELANCFDDVAIPVEQSYRLILRIPDKASLDEVDRAFIEYLACSEPHMRQVDGFLRDSRCQGVVSNYADALGSYVRGVLVRDQAIGTGVTLPPNESDDLYGTALDGLGSFPSPLAMVVSAIVRFVENDFSAVERRTGFRRLDRCNTILAQLVGRDIGTVASAPGTAPKALVSLCPVDQATDRVLDLADRLDRQRHWGPTLLEDCQQAAGAMTLTVHDRLKIHALWASTGLRLGGRDAALEPLRQLAATYPFGNWATDQLDRFEE